MSENFILIFVKQNSLKAIFLSMIYRNKLGLIEVRNPVIFVSSFNYIFVGRGWAEGNKSGIGLN